MATAGRAVLFSGLTVAIGLLGMLCLQLRSLISMGLAGTAVVLLAVGFSLTFLPALLAVLGPRVDALRIPHLHPDQSALSHRAWRWLAAAGDGASLARARAGGGGARPRRLALPAAAPRRQRRQHPPAER